MPPDGFQLLTIRLGDPPDAWRALGFEAETVPDPGPSRVRLGNTTIELTGSGDGFEGWSLAGHTGSLDGLADLATLRGVPDGRSGPPAGGTPPHPNGICAIDHVVVRTGDVDRTASVLGDAGLECRGERSTDSYGPAMRQQFYWLGDVILELVGPGDPAQVTGDPASLFGLALVSEDLDSTTGSMGGLAGTPKDAVQQGRRIAGIRGREVGVSVPLAVMSPHPR